MQSRDRVSSSEAAAIDRWRTPFGRMSMSRKSRYQSGRVPNLGSIHVV